MLLGSVFYLILKTNRRVDQRGQNYHKDGIRNFEPLDDCQSDMLMLATPLEHKTNISHNIVSQRC